MALTALPPPFNLSSSLEVVWMFSESYSSSFCLLIFLPFFLFVFLSIPQICLAKKTLVSKLACFILKRGGRAVKTHPVWCKLDPEMMAFPKQNRGMGVRGCKLGWDILCSSFPQWEAPGCLMASWVSLSQSRAVNTTPGNFQTSQYLHRPPHPDCYTFLNPHPDHRH